MPEAATTRRRPPAAPAFRPPAPDAAVPAFDAIPAPMRNEYIAIDDIKRDQRVNTRPVDLVWVAKKAANFQPEGLGTLIVSRRADGTIIAIDGQNRQALCVKAGWKGWRGDGTIECQVHEGLTLVEEAGLFSLLAGHRSFTAISKFIARQTMKDPVALEITEIVERNSFVIDAAPGGGVITAVSTLEKIHGKDKQRHPFDPPTVLNATLATIVHAWRHTPGGTDQSIIDGIGKIYLSSADLIDEQLLRRILEDYPGGPKKLKSEGASARNTIGGTVGKGVAFLVAQAYDEQQRKPTKKLNFG